MPNKKAPKRVESINKNRPPRPAVQPDLRLVQPREKHMPVPEVDKVLENRLRRMADRQGFRLVKSRRRDPRARDFGTYSLVDENGDSPIDRADIGAIAEYLDVMVELFPDVAGERDR